jgi:hypothetical protein
MRAVETEAKKAQALHADRYLFATSRDLTPHQENQVVAALGPLGVTHDLVWARKRLNEALGAHPEVERRNIKLWLSSAGVLESLLAAGSWHRGEATLDHAVRNARLWVRTESYDEVLRVMEREGVCIAYGPPGVGKTFLAEMVLLAAVAEGWSPVHISGDIDEAWETLLPDDSNQIFYYNDFLGENELRMAKNEPTQMARFIERIRQLREHKRFIMTTREQFLYEAAGKYDSLRDPLGDVHEIGVRIDRDSGRARAEILFNHLYFSSIPQSERGTFAIDNRIITIVDHPAYNPRLIEHALKRSARSSAGEKLEAIKRALDQPGLLWDTSFQELPPLGRQILLTMATLPSRPWTPDKVRSLVAPSDGLSWRSALRILDSAWLNISGSAPGKYMTLANPGCRDYLLTVLDDGAVAEEQIERICTFEQIMSLTQAAGLSPSPASPILRPELAHSLASRKERLMELVRSLVDADTEGGTLSRPAAMLRDAAVMTAVYGQDSDLDWLERGIQSLTESDERLSAAGARIIFELADILAGIEMSDSHRWDELTKRLVLNGIQVISTSRDLDAYEMLPEALRTSTVQESARQSAHRVLADEADYLLHHADDPDSIRLGVADIEHRAEWYGLNFDTGGLVNLAEEMQVEERHEVSWPPIERALQTGQSDDVTSVTQIFSRFDE